MARRSYGTGALYVRRDARGRATWYGKWRAGDRQVMRRPGPSVAEPGPERLAADARRRRRELRRLIAEDVADARRPSASTLEELAPRFLAHKETMGPQADDPEGPTRGCCASTSSPSSAGARSTGSLPVDVESPTSAREAPRGQVAKDVDHHLGLLSSGLPVRAQRDGLARFNPVDAADRPRQQRPDADIRYLTIEDLEAVLAPSRRDAGPDRPAPSTHRGDDRPAPGRAARSALARRRLARGA